MHPSHPLQQFRTEAEQELKNILSWWTNYSIDHGNGGFFGKINNENIADPRAVKGSVLNGRILWTFSAAYNFYKDPSFLETANRAYHYIINHFIDNQYAGVYWTVDAKGQPADTKKQVYACAFILYGLSEYYLASSDEEAKQHAIELYRVMTLRCHDKDHGGFFEAFTREWNESEDQRLSAKDADEKKSMNTNLHVLEAFANLYRIWPDEHLKYHIRDLLKIFLEKIIDPESGHLRLFFDEHWNDKPQLISYGHDIEAAWLLPECAEIIDDRELVGIYKSISLSLTLAAMEGLDAEGGLWYEYDLHKKALILEKHWWPQSEALAGFMNAWELTGEQRFMDAALGCWNFIKKHLLNANGEWYWGVDEDGHPLPDEDKAGLWKCPYHNSRGCLEVVTRVHFK